MTSKEIGVIRFKNELYNDLDQTWSKLFNTHVQLLSSDDQELRSLSDDLRELLLKIEDIQGNYLRPRKISIL